MTYCNGLIPLRGLADKGQDAGGKPNNVWIPADQSALEKVMTFSAWAAREGSAVYVVPGTVAEPGQARSVDVLQMQSVVVDLDAGNVVGMLEHLRLYLGEPTLIVQSGGRTIDGIDKLHVWWRLGTIKRHVTGRGNADKAAVIAAIKARGFNPADDNEADALAILLWATETQGGVR